ncbi:MAG: AAA family ATPase [Bacteroidota bacterium]
MYIKKVKIENIRGIDSFEMDFKNPAGWHVLIGDNGSGKTSIIRAIALALVGPEQAYGLRPDWRDWLKKDKDYGSVELEVELGPFDTRMGSNKDTPYKYLIGFERKRGGNNEREHINLKSNKDESRFNWKRPQENFSAGFGPFRRFQGGNPEWSKVFHAQPGLGAHLSVFGEDVALTEITEWLKDLRFTQLDSPESDRGIESADIIKFIKNLINEHNFLPNNVRLSHIGPDGVTFIDADENEIIVEQLSDGYRSILSLTLELLRQIFWFFPANFILEHFRENVITIHGAVLIDEIDAHLHPTWQTQIGQWFTKVFPNIQFIVTTHSPLICRAAEKGSIWRLAAPGSGEESKEITGIDRNRLIYGNVLDAYGTEAFGDNVSVSEESNEMLNKLAKLNVKSLLKGLTEDERAEQQNLKAIFPTENPLSNDKATR